jgi:hypothetical protein
MAYESVFEIFEAIGADGAASKVAFKKAGTLASGDRPELYFFDVDARQVIVCVSGDGLGGWQRANRYLSREEKIDVAGLFLKRKIETGSELNAEDLRIDESELPSLLRALGIRK